MQPTSLTSVEELDDFREDLEEVHVLVAVVLDFVDKEELWTARASDGGQQAGILLQVLQGLISNKLLLFAPLYRVHHRVPDLHTKPIPTMRLNQNMVHKL